MTSRLKILQTVRLITIFLFLIVGSGSYAFASEVQSSEKSFLITLFKQYFPSQDVDLEKYDTHQYASDAGAYACPAGTSLCAEGDPPLCCTNSTDSNGDGKPNDADGNGARDDGETCCDGTACCDAAQNEACRPVDPYKPEEKWECFDCGEYGNQFITCGFNCCDRSEGSNEECCGDTCIDTSEGHECCGGKTACPAGEGSGFSCCGDNCAPDSVEVPDGNGGMKEVPVLCCGGTPYIEGEATCCDNKLYNPNFQCCKPGDTCCGALAYSEEEYECCVDKLYQEGGALCCNGDLFEVGADCCEDAIGDEPKACEPGKHCEMNNAGVIRCVDDPIA